MKKCSKCSIEKPRNKGYFNSRKDSKDGLQGICRECSIARQREVRKSKAKEIAEYQRQYRMKNAVRLKEQTAIYYQENKEKIDKANKQYYQENYEEIKRYRAEYYHNNFDRISEHKKIYHNENKEYFARISKKYYQNNKEKYIAQANKFKKENPELVAVYKQRWRLKNKEAMRGYNKAYKIKKMALPNTFDVDDLIAVKKYFDNCCSYCGMSEQEHLKVFGEQLHQEHFIPVSKGGEYTHNNIILSCRSCNASKGNRDFFVWYPTHESYSENREKNILEYLGYMENTQQLSIL